jgi:hypothetical protein
MHQVTVRQRSAPYALGRKPAISRHGADSVEAKSYDFWSSIMPRHARKRGVSRQVEQDKKDPDWLLQR